MQMYELEQLRLSKFLNKKIKFSFLVFNYACNKSFEMSKNE